MSVVESVLAKHGIGEGSHVYQSSIKGFASHLSAEAITAIRVLPEVEYIEQDGVGRIAGFVSQENAEYGLARISHRAAGATTYNYDESAGKGVCAYVIDSGVDVNNTVGVYLFSTRVNW